MSVDSNQLRKVPDASTEETTEQPAAVPKSKMESLNEQTRARHSAISADSLKGIKNMHEVFNGYKIGDEATFLADDPKESEVLDHTQTVAETGVTASGVVASSLEMAENALDGWSNGNGIAGAALTFIGYIKNAYAIMKSDASGKEKAAELGKETANAAFDMAGNIVDVIEGFGGTVLKGFKVIPGLGMVIDAIEAAIAVYKVIKADRARVRMNDSRRLFKEKYMNRPIESEGETQGKSMIKKVGRFNIRRLWKKTDITVDEKTMKARRDELRGKANLTDSEKEELKDITKFLIQDRLRRGNRNKEIKGAGTIVAKIAAITGKIASLVSTFGGSLVAESIAGGIDLALDSADVTSTIGDAAVGAYQGRGGRDKGSQYTQYLMEVIGGLPSTYDTPENKSEYSEAKDMVDATGVDSGKLNKVATQAKTAASDSDKKKGKANAYKMFIKLFEG
ncbi:hypothetical protein [Fusibacter ferrireducens]|uniref:Uncharacterized protein n=1 Tax=Fusibacter ferrireducens TaxID=2785058 RepID=A0ABR9ZNJ0_9FIRM|nr:hypothetical protein [Fusibacter ferrireducens]MBF4692038.1 hypothetical protein [Fusibacter ferrireducens]